MSNKQQTSVEWLVEKWSVQGTLYSSDINQAKKIHKEEIINAANSENSVDINYGEQYYNETYGGNK